MGKDLKGKELGVGLTQRKDGKYSAKYTTNSGSRREKYFEKLSDARIWLNERLYEKNMLLNGKDLLVDEWYNIWMSTNKEGIVSPSTVKNYKARYKMNIKKNIGMKKLDSVKPIDCQYILNKMDAEGYAKGTIQQTRITLHAIFKDAVLNEYITKNPVNETVHLPYSEDEDDFNEKRVLTVNEQIEFSEYATNRMYNNAYQLVLQTGLRVGEIGGLKWEDIDLIDKTLYVRRTLHENKNRGGFYFGKPKSKSSKRIVPLNKEALDILRSQKSFQMKMKCKSSNWTENDEWQNLVFTTINGNPVGASTFNTMIKRIVNNINADREAVSKMNNTTYNRFEKFTMHSLRHTFATRAIESGIKPKVLQKILGHSSITITMDLYVHVTDDEFKTEIEKLSSSLDIIKNNIVAINKNVENVS